MNETDAPSAPATDRALLIQAECIRGHFTGMMGGLVGITVVATGMAFLYAKVVDAKLVAGWLAMVYVMAVVRLWMWLRFRRTPQTAEAIRSWRPYVVVIYGALGWTWGVGMILLYPLDSFPYQIVLPVVTTSVGTLSAYALGFILPAFYAFVLPAVVLCALPFFMEGGALHLTLGLLILLFIPVAARYAHQYHGHFTDSVRLRLENLDLIEKLSREKRVAEEANVAKSRFLAAASHDLRQPMHALGLFVQSLEEANIPEAECATLLNVRRTVKSMEDLFNSLLDVSKLDAGVVSVRKETVPIRPIVEGVAADFQRLAERKGLRLNIHCPDRYVETDPVLLERVLRNLVSNAVQHTSDGGVLLRARPRGTQLRIEVWDTGPGIPSDQQRAVFREFHQLKNPERDRRKGLGLGLAIVERLARLLAHPIELRSREGKGSVFTISVPIGSAANWRPRPDPSLASTTFDFRGRYVVVVDDEIAVQDGMNSLLTKWYCDVVAGGSAAEVLVKLSSSTRVPDLIISDYRLRDGDNGIDVVERLRDEFNADIPAFLITGDTGPERLRETAASGLQVLHKPFNPARLRALLGSLLRTDRQGGRLAVDPGADG